jgi:hypothetical protein
MWWCHRAPYVIRELVPLRGSGFIIEFSVVRVVLPAAFVDIRTSNPLRGCVLETCISMEHERTYGGTIGLGMSPESSLP